MVNKQNRVDLIQSLKRRGYTVTNTADNGLLVEKNTWWGRFAYDSGIGKSQSHIKWGRTIVLMFVYGLGFIGGVYWLIRKGQMEEEVRTILS